jgi:hypothetical protein
MKPIDIKTIPRDESIAAKLELLDADTVRDLIHEANQQVANLSDACQNVLSRCTTFLGWAIAAFTALCAALVSVVAAGDPSPITLTMYIYGVVAVALVIAVLLAGPLTGSTDYGPGGEPSNILRDDVVHNLEGYGKKQTQIYILGWHLIELQWKINYNAKANEKLVFWYRTSILLFVGAVAIGFLLLGGLCIFI